MKHGDECNKANTNNKNKNWCYFEALGLFSVEPQHRHPVSIVGGTKRTTNATCSASNCIGRWHSSDGRSSNMVRGSS